MAVQGGEGHSHMIRSEWAQTLVVLPSSQNKNNNNLATGGQTLYCNSLSVRLLKARILCVSLFLPAHPQTTCEVLKFHCSFGRRDTLEGGK